MLDISDIRFLQTIAEQGSINKAAEQLHASQPTLSKRLGRLEQQLKITLFHRHNGGMTPTHATHYLIERSARLQGEMRTLERQIELMANLEQGRLNIGVGPIIEQLYFPRLLLDFTAATKNIRISLQTEPPERLQELLMSGGIDVAIGPFDTAQLPDTLKVMPVEAMKVMMVARAEHPIFNEPQPYSLETLQRYPSIGPSIPAHFIPQDVAVLLEDSIPLIACENYTTSKSVVLSSDYLTGGPEVLFKEELAAGLLKPISLPSEMHWRSFCVIRPESEHIPVVKRFLTLLADVKA